jgi:hypothetical protein
LRLLQRTRVSSTRLSLSPSLFHPCSVSLCFSSLLDYLILLYGNLI